MPEDLIQQSEVAPDDVTDAYTESRASGDAEYVNEQLNSLLGGGGEDRKTMAEEMIEAPVAAVKEAADSVAEGAAAAVKDISAGIREIPRAVASGVIAAAQETLDLVGELTEQLPLSEGFRTLPREGVPRLPTIDDPQSQTGKLLKSVSQFVTGFIGAGKIKFLQKLTPAVRGAAKGAVADATVFDPHEERLSNMIQEFPALANPVNEFLAADPSDTTAEGRFKSAIEGAVPGAAIEGFLKALRIIKAGRRMKAEEDMIDPTTGKPRLREDALDILGDTKSAELFTARVTRKVEAGLEQTKPAKPMTPEQKQAHKQLAKRTLLAEVTAGHLSEQHAFRGVDRVRLEQLARTGDWDAVIGIAREGDPGHFASQLNKEGFVAYGDGFGIIIPPGKHTPSGRMGEVIADAKLDPKTLQYVVGDKILTWKELQKEMLGIPKAAAEPKIFINFARIEAPEDIQRIIQDMADAHAGKIKAAQRGVRPWEKTKLSASQRNAWGDLLARRRGETLNAEQTFAARQLWITSANKLSEVSTLAAENPSEANLFVFRKMLATHYAIQKEVLAARTEAGRALDAWRIPAGGGGESARQINALLENFGGADVSKELAKRISILAKHGLGKELEKVVEGSVWARTKNAVLQVWINGLLSNPTTHMVNALSNLSVIGMQVYERRAAAYIGKIMGTENGVELAETLAQLSGLVDGFKDTMRAGHKQRGMSFLPENVPEELALGLRDPSLRPRGGALSADSWHIANDTWLGQALDFTDISTRLPGQALRIGDEIFKTIGYRMELHALAARQAAQDVASGKISPDMLKARQAEIIANPPENVRIEAVDAALYQTFTNKPNEFLNKGATWFQQLPLLGRLILPFKNTPLNLFLFTFERTPLAPLAKEFRADFSAGGARRDLALARMSTGTMIMLAALDMAHNGTITGKAPKEPGARQLFMRENKQGYSVRDGNGRYWSFSRGDPLGMTFGMAADFAQILANSQEPDASLEEAFAAAVFAVAKNVTSKTYMQGVSEFFDAVSDPDRYGEKWFQKAAGSLAPAGVAQVARTIDPYMRTSNSVIEAIQRRTPFWSEGLPLYRDLWGRPVDYRSGLGAFYDALSPIYSKKEAPEPIDKEMERLGYFPTMPDRRITHNGVVLDLEGKPHVYSRYVELSGNGIKHPAWQAGAKDYLNAVVGGKHPMSHVYSKVYSDGPEGSKADFIRRTLREFREMATDQIMAEFPELQVEYEQKRDLYKKINRNLIR